MKSLRDLKETQLVNLNVAKKYLKRSPPPFPAPSEGEGRVGGKGHQE